MNISGYQLGRQVAENHFSTVYNALNLDSSKTVTVQAYLPALAADKAFCEQLKSAVEKLGDRRFGIMTPVIRAVVEGDNSYLITEYFPCPDQVPEELPQLNVKQILKIGLSVATTLSQLHDAGLLHGGIEKDNLFLPSAEQPQLSPPALHRVLPAVRLNSLAKLSLEQQQYLAPEAEQELSEATDFYALGVLLYQLICQQAPFPADDAESLRQLKATPEKLVFRNHQKHLQPLLKGLLAVDKKQRIQHINDFEQALADCMLRLRKTAASVQGPADDTQVELSASQTGSAREGRRNWRSIAAIALLVAVSLALYLQLQDDSKPGPEQATQSITRQALKPRLSIPQPVETETPEDDGAAVEAGEALYQQTQSSIKLGNYGQALLSINSALKETPNDNRLKLLKRDIEREIAVRSLIYKANNQIRELKLTRPPGDNAYESFQFLQGLLNDQDDRAQQGFENIAGTYYDLASSAFDKEQNESALELIATGMEVKSDHAPLQELQKKIIDQLNLQAQQREQQRLAEQQRAAAQAAVRAHKLAEQKAIEAARLAEQKRLRELEEQRLVVEREQERQRLRRLNQDKINTLLSSATRRLEGGQLSLPGIDAARQDYLQIAPLDDNDDRILRLKQDLIDAYAMLANQQKSSFQYDNALATLRQGLELDGQEETLLQAQREIQALVETRIRNDSPAPSIQPEPLPEVPIIGTF